MQNDLREKLEKLEEQAARLRVWFGVAGFEYSAIERIMNGTSIHADNMTPLELSLQAQLDAANATIAKLRERDTVRPEVDAAMIWEDGHKNGRLDSYYGTSKRNPYIVKVAKPEV